MLFALATFYIRWDRAALGVVGCSILRTERQLPPLLTAPFRWWFDFWVHTSDVETLFNAIQLPVSPRSKLRELGEASALICGGVDLRARNNNGDTPLLSLLKQPHYREPDARLMVVAMLKAGVDVNEIDRDGNTALHLAVEEGPPKIVRKLLKYGADPQRANTSGDTALHLAVRKAVPNGDGFYRNHLQKIALLASAPGGREAIALRDREGRPTLHLVSLIPRSENALQVLKLLLKSKPDLMSTDLEGNTAEQFAIIRQKSRIAEALAQHRSQTAR